MITAGCLNFSPEGRVLVDVVNPPVTFSGGTPIAETGGVAVSGADPEVYLSGLGYMAEGAVCARQGSVSGYDGGFARTGVGSLALATTEPIAYYQAGVPLVADGRVAVKIINPPPGLRAFSDGYDAGYL